MAFKSKNAKKNKEYNIDVYKKGFITTSEIDGKTVNEYFQYKDIERIIHHPNTGIEIIGINGSLRVFYNDVVGESENLFNYITIKMVEWMDSNLN